jgi:hypothetical protein
MTEPLRPYDVHGKLDTPAALLAVALAQWEGRDDTKAEPEVREAANTAMEAIDAMLRDLHLMRARLITEIRASDDAAEVRARELLDRRDRQEGSDG